MPARPLAVASLLLACLAAAPAAGAPLESALEASLAHPALRGAELGVLVVRADDGAALFARAADRPLVPASNLKILTALAALEMLGPAYRFETRVVSDAPPDPQGGVERLYLVGGGDPALGSEQWWRLAADLRRAGLREVRGDLVLDDSAFDAQRWHAAWTPLSSRAYHAPVGALAANYGAFAVEVRPGARAGDPALVEVDPPVAYLALASRARTGSAGSRAALAVERGPADGARERVSVAGSIPLGGAPRVLWRSVADPARYAGAVARMQLEAVGIRVLGATRTGVAPAGAHELLVFEGQPLGQIVTLFLKHSTNPVAEMLLKALGRAATGEPGSWERGRVAALASLARLGVDTRGLTWVDGSGLARANRVAPRTLVEALRAARASFRFGPELVAALPIAGGDGTLERRAGAAAGALRAKTGLLTGVTGLAGFARNPERGELVFSILANGYRSSDDAARAALDGFAAALVGGAQDGRREP